MPEEIAQFDADAENEEETDGVYARDYAFARQQARLARRVEDGEGPSIQKLRHQQEIAEREAAAQKEKDMPTQREALETTKQQQRAQAAMEEDTVGQRLQKQLEIRKKKDKKDTDLVHEAHTWLKRLFVWNLLVIIGGIASLFFTIGFLAISIYYLQSVWDKIS